MRERWWCGERCYRRSGGVGQKRAQKQAFSTPLSFPVSWFTARPIQLSEHYSSSSFRDLFTVGIDCLSVRRHCMVHAYTKTARPCVEPREPSSGRNHVRQPFSRLRLIAPRLNLRSGSHLRPCLVAPTVDSASLEHPDSATETAPAPFARWLHKSESPT